MNQSLIVMAFSQITRNFRPIWEAGLQDMVVATNSFNEHRLWLYPGIAVRSVTLPHRYGNSHATWDHTVLPAPRQRWHSRLYPSRSRYSIKRLRRDARLSWPRLLYDGLGLGHRCKKRLFWSRFYVFNVFYLKKTLAKFRAASRLTRSTFKITATK